MKTGDRKQQLNLLLVRVAGGLVCLAFLSIAFLSISRLNHTGYLGFELTEDAATSPGKAALFVLSSPSRLPFQAGDRILSVDGLAVSENSQTAIVQKLKKSGQGFSPVLFQHGANIEFGLFSSVELNALKVDFIRKNPVVISAIHPRSGLQINPGVQLVGIDYQLVWNKTDALKSLLRKRSGDSVVLSVRSGQDFKAIRYRFHLSEWDRHQSANSIYLIYAFFAFLCSFFLLLKLPDDRLAIAQSLVYCCTLSLILAEWLFLYPPISVPAVLIHLGILLFPASMYWLILNFPITASPSSGQRLHGALVSVLILLSLAAGWTMSKSPVTFAALQGVAGMVIAGGLLGYSSRLLRSTRATYERSSYRIIYLGLILGIFCSIVGFTLKLLFPAASNSIWTALLILATLQMPLTILFSYVRTRVHYTDLIFKKSLSYTAVSGIILFLYFLIVVQLGSFIHQLLHIENIWVLLVFLVFSAFAVEPLKNLFTQLIDRVFYRNQAKYRDYILESSRQLNYVVDIPVIVDITLNKICEVAYLSGGYLLLKEEKGSALICKAARDPEIKECLEVRLPLDWRISSWVSQSREPVEIFDQKNLRTFHDLPPAEREFLLKLKVSVIAPLFSREELLGVLLLKRKLSGELYSYEDITFLGLLCNQAAIALDNAMFRDKEKSMLRSLYQQKRLALMGQMSANIAHEIRNPLVAIKGLGKLVEDSFGEDDRRKQHMRILNDEVSRLQRVVSDLVRFARPVSVQKEEIDLNEVVEGCLELYGEEIQKHGIRIDLSRSPGPVKILADHEKIKQVIINLLQNAIESMPLEGGTILIETERQLPPGLPGIFSGSAIFRIHDSGAGIPPEKREMVFEPFFTSKKSGTGLGLAIAREIIEEHGGQIEVIDTSRGGACFEFKIPYAFAVAGVSQ